MGKHAVLFAAFIRVASYGPIPVRRRCKYCIMTPDTKKKNGQGEIVKCYMRYCENYKK